jgi:basic membrane lipoprotein Med (substrate-binding protein (PBP1-ABC) superfamily)
VYTEATACLLTSSSGISDQQAAAVWSGMESASVRTRTKVSYLAVSGDDSVANAVPYVNTLVQRRCGLIIAVGANEVYAVKQRAASFPGFRFAVVGSGPSSNVAVITAGDAEAVSGAADRLVASITDR